ncbi:glycoside hydrolase [Delitschia confertaspora ATCC 74209]|uniref:Mannosyl-oligosaccharide glucosidase n=1 Tax=Delitschia confertaspora ATCC 74209 TaxID=1513339 RepID=A0A9P4MW29_9PLEO|nr:glycoside hydrolase [Delitschia confertaspora ATCC 74209]
MTLFSYNRFLVHLLLVLFGLVIATLSQSDATEVSQRWGPYRPNLYFGVRPQVPDTLLMGLMWADGENPNNLLETLRYTCEQDESISYGWSLYDTLTGGIQETVDRRNHVNITTKFIKTPDGKGWAMRVQGVPLADMKSNVRTVVIFHLAMEDSPSAYDLEGHNQSISCSQSTAIIFDRRRSGICSGIAPTLGDFEIQIFENRDSKIIEDLSVISIQVPQDKIWQAADIFRKYTKNPFNHEQNKEGNTHFLKITFEGAFAVDFIYSSASQTKPLGPEGIRSKITSLETWFPSQFRKVFPLTAPFQTKQHESFAQALLSNLMGGLGFFHGDSKADLSHAIEYEETDLNFWEKAESAHKRATITTTKPASLLSHTPSRPFFPRGFLWDEGFHLLPILEWDLDLGITVIRSWLALMDEDGWIGREQILGPEARSKVPEQFQVQYPHYANPPTLLVLLSPLILSKIQNPASYNGHPTRYLTADSSSALLKELYPLLTKHYNWFRRTQAGNFTEAYPRPENAVAGEAYRWRGRTPSHTLTSGLDDYPRAQPPHPGELHVDALAWVIAAAGALERISQFIGAHADATIYAQHRSNGLRNLEALHWNDSEGMYCDATISSGSFEHVCHLGYVSLIPFLLGLISPTHPRLTKVLDSLSDPERLWSPFGIRSLSRQNQYYGKDEDYWRGAIWINLNVLIVRQLHNLATQAGSEKKRARRLAQELRKNLVKTVYDNWERTGFVWEQYDDKTGEGRRSRAFTGWTATVILLLGMDLEDRNGRGMPSGSWWRTNRGIRTGSGLWVEVLVLTVGLMGLVWYFRRRLLGLWRDRRGLRGRRPS